uniref:FAD:protein FMN transferase n=1 Tax=Panagrellus redivivus TaxID=6233 RepID=A0A7E4VLM9_PANRE
MGTFVTHSTQLHTAAHNRNHLCGAPLYYDREMKETLTELTTVCRAHLTGYEITVNSSSVDGTIVKQHGNKTLEVFVGFYARR